MCKSEIFAEILQAVSQETEISSEQIACARLLCRDDLLARPHPVRPPTGRMPWRGIETCLKEPVGRQA